MGTMAGPPPGRGLLAGCAILAAVPVVLAACAGPPRRPAGAGPATPPGRSAVTAPPLRLAPGTRFLPVSEVAVLSNDRTLVAEASWGCSGPPRLVATPLTRSVLLALAQPPVPRGAICSTVLAFGPVRTTLPWPLGQRRLVQRATLAPVPVVYQSRLPPVAVLPPGYHLSALVPGAQFAGPGTGARLPSTRTYVAARGGLAPILVCQAAGPGNPAGAGPGGWPVRAVLSVHGNRAVYRAGGTGSGTYARMITWRAGGQLITVASLQTASGQTVPAEGELLATARGIQAGAAEPGRVTGQPASPPS